jgi:F0F1-type ATP synthase membrane subunit b/b'
MKNLISLFGCLALPLSAMAAPAATGEGLPRLVTLQAINFILFVLFVVFLYRKYNVGAALAAKKEKYLATMKEATRTRDEALARKTDLETRLNTLLQTAEQSRQKARGEAQGMKSNMISQAHESAQKMKDDVRKTAAIEVAKAEIQIKDQLLEESVQRAREQIKQVLADADQKQLQQDFVDKIQVVRS